MFYRRKVVLGLIELLGGEVEKLRLQKLLFLYAMRKTNPEYDFVPYRYGCYSFSAKADLDTMVKKGFLSETEKRYAKSDATHYLSKLKVADQQRLQSVVKDYGGMKNSALIKHTYLSFPFYAIHSTIARDVLPEHLYSRVQEARPRDAEITLFTIGYEGISLESYLLKLVKNNVKLLVDVRKNPLSMKFGFSKSTLKKYCNALGIDYMHIPEVGINSSKRRNLETKADYAELFDDYQKTTLNETLEYQQRILALLKRDKRIALTCFEADHCDCHRSHLAKAVSSLPDFKYSLIHF